MGLNKYSTSEIANKGRAVTLLHPATQVSIGVRFFVLGSDSQEFQRISRKQEAARLEKQKKCRRGVYYLTPEETEENTLEMLVGLTTGWEEDVFEGEGENRKITGVRKDIELNDGEFVQFTPEAAKNIYSSLGLKWIREQIDAEIGDRRDFLPQAKRN